jgi:hypothetical protein
MEQVIKHARLYNMLMKNLGDIEDIVKIVLTYLEKTLYDNAVKEGRPTIHQCSFYRSWNEFVNCSYNIGRLNNPEVYWETNADYVLFNPIRTPSNEVIKNDVVYIYSHVNHFRHAVKVEKDDHDKIVEYLKSVGTFSSKIDVK